MTYIPFFNYRPFSKLQPNLIFVETLECPNVPDLECSVCGGGGHVVAAPVHRDRPHRLPVNKHLRCRLLQNKIYKVLKNIND